CHTRDGGTTSKPHARGDGPDIERQETPRGDQAPRTWGWTVPHRDGPSWGAPSPTHVGMDRARELQEKKDNAKPHARGDGPNWWSDWLDTADQAPRTWGWTDRRRITPARSPPSPTHVGMDRGHGQVGRRHRAKPHARGDGPEVGVALADLPCQAPRTWGWTADQAQRIRSTGPSPTHVGMDRDWWWCCCHRCAKPHARGDGPVWFDAADGKVHQAPRTWGWTVPPGRPDGPVGPSPTH